jgi:hypothetical protein
MARSLLHICWVTFLLTTAWAVLLVVDVIGIGPVYTFDQILSHVSRLSFLYYIGYVNAGLVTLAVTALLAGLYVRLRRREPLWASIALAFVPVYAGLNLSVYLSQITVIPGLLRLRADGEFGAMAIWALRLLIHIAPGSLAEFVNGLAYAVLGIPSVIFGALLWGRSRMWNAAVVLLISSAVADLVALLGLVVDSQPLKMGVLAGGGLFWAALLLMIVALQEETTAREAPWTPSGQLAA